MAHVAAPSSSPPPQAGGPPAPHGTKRAADTALEHEQRLSKRFDLLNLVDHNGTRLYIPVPGSTDAARPRPPADPISTPHPLASTIPLQKRDRPARPPRRASDGMDIEDTPHRVYIHDLAAELSDIESDEEKPIFLSDIEKHLSKIPQHVLTGPEPKANEHNQMVLYNIPTSLTLPEHKDSVRKAIVDARQRIRNMQANPVVEPARSMRGGVAAVLQHTPPPAHVDSEAMDLD
ncbi:hypothetical protein BDU57DRAFT_559788 [Ampelomyces quisqualis]|uniref:Uncharacterized protein n=1 Tax=Ampelomyces quisqualis TaxID=50730 RepID=A0A6A5QDQ3_AMPQU|nr:hypothetical protein BDU57DRAFT_559788 [Ampelomyces quisqualis]